MPKKSYKDKPRFKLILEYEKELKDKFDFTLGKMTGELINTLRKQINE